MTEKMAKAFAYEILKYHCKDCEDVNRDMYSLGKYIGLETALDILGVKYGCLRDGHSNIIAVVVDGQKVTFADLEN